MLRNYGLTVIKNTEKRHLLIDFQQQKGKTSQKAPVSPDKTPASPVRTPVSSDKLPQKPLTPATVPQKQTEKLTGILKKVQRCGMASQNGRQVRRVVIQLGILYGILL
ncbi:hypothetical protein EB564_0001085 (plasmid) [Escherichia coli]|nr:hypothetical protein [Escherichia coli]